MKKNPFFMLMASLLLLSSCSSKKNVAQQQYPPQYPPMYAQNPVQTNQQKSVDTYMQDRIAEEQRNMNTCEYLALHWDNDLRGYGEGSGFDREAARENAMMNAQNQLLEIMNLWASDFSRRTNTGTQLNGVNRQERVSQTDQIRFAEGDLVGVQVLHVTYENISNGVVCHICASLNAAAATTALLSQAQSKQIIKNAEEFRASAEESREQIRLMRTGENYSTIKATKDNEMMQNNLNQQHQREMEKMNAQQSSSTNAQYSISVNGQTYGPCTYAQLSQMIPTGQFTANTYVWRPGMAQWEVANRVPELQGLFAPAPSSQTPPPAPNYQTPPAPPAH